MGIKKSVWLSDEAQSLCEHLSHGKVNWSGSLNSMASRYEFLISENMPNLTDIEKNIFAVAFNGRLLNDDIRMEIVALPWTISEACEYDEQIPEFFEEGEINYDEFMEKVNNFSPSERLAIIDMTQRFWNKGQKA